MNLKDSDDRTVLVVVADPAVQGDVIRVLQTRRFQCVVASTADQAFTALAATDFRFTVIDLDLNGAGNGHRADGVALLNRLSLQPGDPGPIIGLADTSDRLRADASSIALSEVVPKTFRPQEIERAVDEVLARQAPAGKSDSNDEPATRVRREMALWRSPKMLAVRQILREAAGVDVTVLITGETGTGKDIVAHAIHALSTRRQGPFVKVNCAAVPRELLETELFGHERGAFTGAHRQNIGKFESAHRGTIFLDEIGDLHPALQAKLLHVLQDGDFSRVGGKSILKTDVRVLAATNQDLEKAVAERRFREDLYYRLNVVHVFVPPLRDRVEEIPVLAEYFVERYSKIFRRAGFSLPASVMDRLLHHRYPGNVRELENLIKRMIVLGDPLLARTVLGNGHLEVKTNGPAPTHAADVCLRDITRNASLAAERDAIARVLEQTGWHRVRAAKALRISYRALLYKMKRVGLHGPRPEAAAVIPSAPDGAGG